MSRTGSLMMNQRSCSSERTLVHSADSVANVSKSDMLEFEADDPPWFAVVQLQLVVSYTSSEFCNSIQALRIQ